MPEVPERVQQALADRYAVERELGQGGMATVYLAEDLRHRRKVALKVLRADLAAALGPERFLREIATTAQLSHPHILPLLDSGEADGTLFYVMPFVEGESLRDRLAREKQMPLDEAVQITREVADALSFAHSHGVIHRDIKPENILLEAGHAVVADFGIARAVSEAGGTRLTETGLAVGTPAYMSPEQAAGDRAIDGRSDLYSLGCVLYEMLSGETPYTGPTPQAILAKKLTEPLPRISVVRDTVPPGIEAALNKALARTPADRFVTASQFAAVLAHPEMAGAVLAPRGLRQRRRLAAGAVTAAAVLAAILLLRARSASDFQARDWLLVADFDYRSGDSLLGRGLTSALTVSLEQSHFANVVSRQVVTRMLRAMNRPDTTTLTPPTAREVALRAGAKAIVFPRIERTTDGFALSLRAEAAATQTDLALREATARSSEEILPTLSRLAGHLRGDLGEPLRSTEAPVQLAFATTSSLEALAAWSEGQQEFSAGRNDAAIAAYQRALELDSNFAMAHKSLGVAYYYANRRPDGDRHFERALALRDRLTERERLLVTADVANWRNQASEAVTAYRRVLDSYPDDRDTRASLAYALLRALRYDEAAAEYRNLLGSDSSVFGWHINLASADAMLGHYPAALVQYAAAFRLQPGQRTTNYSLVHEYAITLAEAGFPDSARRLIGGLAVSEVGLRAGAARSYGLIDVRQGRGDSALRHFREAAILSRELPNRTTELRNRLFVARTLLWLDRPSEARDELRQAVALARGPNMEAYYLSLAAAVAAAARDGSATATLARLVSARADTGNANDRLAAHVTAAEAALLAGQVRRGIDEAEAAFATSRTAATLHLFGRALERAGRLDEARDRDAEAGRQPSGAYEDVFSVLAATADAGRLSAQVGDTAAARSYYRRLLERWRDGEPTFPPLRRVEEALARLGPQ